MTGRYILKPIPGELENREQILANEHLTMQIAKQVYGINVADNGMIFFRDGVDEKRRSSVAGLELPQEERFHAPNGSRVLVFPCAFILGFFSLRANLSKPASQADGALAARRRVAGRFFAVHPLRDRPLCGHRQGVRRESRIRA